MIDDSEKLYLYAAISFFIIFVCLTTYYYQQGDKLFKLLAERYPKYYKENQEPMNFSDPISTMWATYYHMLLLLRGIPKDFPDDEEARKLARKTRKVGLITYLYLIVLFILQWASIIFEIPKQ